MARIRSVKPELPQDAKLASLSRETRYHFVLLWTIADDAGYFRASTRSLLGQLYPHDADISAQDAERMTAELVAHGFLEMRVTEDGPIGWVRNWSKHQKIDRPSKSHLADAFARPSRVSRETLDAGVLSPESRVLSPEDGARPAVGDALSELLVEYNFGQFAGSVEGIVRSSRNAVAVVQTLRMHLTGEMGHAHATPEQLGLAAQQYLANGAAFSARYFGGFVRRAVLPSDAATDDGRAAAADGQGRAALVFGQIRLLVEETQQPGQQLRRFIPKASVEALGQDVFKAYNAVGGADAFLSVEGPKIGFLLRDFSAALKAAS